MPPCQSYGQRPVVLLTNDDGPPSASSPNIYGFCKLLQDRLDWDVKVVIPDCQKSWVGKAYAISDIITASYFYPKGPDGLTGDVSPVSRPLKDGETMEWVLLAGTPASCSSIALHNLYPGQIDMVISGPNHGRNSSTAFALSSGTLGAALAASLSVPIAGPSSGASSLHVDHIPSIAVSYGVVARPCPSGAIELAHEVSVDVCKRLWDDWGYENGPDSNPRRKVQVYSVNVPLVLEVLQKDKRTIRWTTMWRSNYGQLFKATKLDPALNWWANSHRPNQTSNLQSFATALQTSLQVVVEDEKENFQDGNEAIRSDIASSDKTSFEPDDDRNASNTKKVNKPVGNTDQPRPKISTTATAGPNALPTPNPASPSDISASTVENATQLKFHFAPTMGPLLNPPADELPVGSDAWAFAKGYISVTPIRAEYGGLDVGGVGFGSDDSGEAVAGRIWK